MSSICNILVIVDPTAKDQPAVAKGAALAEKFAARLELFACETKAAQNIRYAEHARHPTGLPLVTDFKAVLETLAKPLRARGLDVNTESVVGDPLHAALLDRMKRTHAEIVVKDTHHHTLAQRTFLTNTDWELIRGCPTALLLVKPKAWSAHSRVCAAVDPRHADDKPLQLDHAILEKASTIARRLDGELHIANVYIPLAFLAGAAVAVPPMVDVSPAALEVEHQAKFKELSALASDYQIDAQHIHVEVGSTGDTLCRLAKQLNIDIMVLGAISRSALKRAVIGSTAESILERLPCDLLVVKAPSFAEFLPI
jgi:universal stress protein E